MIAAGNFNNTRDGMRNDVVLSAPKIALRKITFNTPDATVLDIYTWRFTLKSPIYNVVFIDWAMYSNVTKPCLLRIDEIPSSGITSSGQSYFASLLEGHSQNTLIQPQPLVKFNPISVSQLTITMIPTTTVPFIQETPWTVELYFYTEDP